MAEKQICNPERMNVERMIAQLLVIGGGLFWIAAAYAGRFVFQDTSVFEAVGSAAYPLAATVVVFAVGMWSERLAATLLYTASVLVMVWGVTAGWEPVVWLVMTFVLSGPMFGAGVAYQLAARMDGICSLEALPMSMSGLEN